MNILQVNSSSQWEIQKLSQIAGVFRRQHPVYLTVIQKNSRKMDFHTGAVRDEVNFSYLFNMFPALAIGVYVNVFA